MSETKSGALDESLPNLPSFEDMGIDPFLAERLAKGGIVRPTAIQARAIPRLLGGESLLFSSPTGTGKTLAYLLPLLKALLIPRSESSVKPVGWPLALIIAPTYELCSQIKEVLDFLLEDPGPFYPISRSLVIGAGNLSRQIESVRREKPEIIVGNPGRLLLLAKMGKLKLGKVSFLILDEGDRLISGELIQETRELVSLLNPERLTAGCSATLSRKSLEQLKPFFASRPFAVEEAEGDLLRTHIEHWALFAEGRGKIRTLRSFLAAAHPRKTLVFTSQGWDVGNILSQLQHHHVGASGLWGNMDRRARKKALDDFRADRVKILVTTDLAARGLDIPEVSHIVALDTPETEEPYIHRAGRTARAGKRGIMVTIGDEEELERLANLEKRLKIIVYPKMLAQGRILPAG